MSGPRTALILLGLLAGAFAAAVLIGHHGRTPTVASSPTTMAPSSPTETTSSPPAGGTARHRTPLQAVIRGFAAAYAAYLDGGPAGALVRYGSITATAQATGDGRIPVAFRDGALSIASSNAFARTCCSAQETLVLASRSERYPLTVNLLYEQNGWQVADLTPADLSMDRHLPKPEGVHTPAAANAAARKFATAYVRYHAGEATVPTDLTAAAKHAIAQGSDSLAGTRLPHGSVRLVSIAYGPPTGDEFAATATVEDGKGKLTFSFLVVHTKTGWIGGAFL